MYSFGLRSPVLLQICISPPVATATRPPRITASLRASPDPLLSPAKCPLLHVSFSQGPCGMLRPPLLLLDSRRGWYHCNFEPVSPDQSWSGCLAGSGMIEKIRWPPAISRGVLTTSASKSTPMSARTNPSETLTWLFFDAKNVRSSVHTIIIQGHALRTPCIGNLDWVSVFKSKFRFRGMSLRLTSGRWVIDLVAPPLRRLTLFPSRFPPCS